MQTLDQRLREEHQHLLSLEKKSFLQYGTSGFRARADLLPFLALRLGMIVGSKAKNMVLGVMITASHNGIQDNGFKIVQPLGGMLTPEQEQEVQTFYQQEQTPEFIQKSDGEVWVAYDTRPSSKGLSQLVIQGIQYSGAKTQDLGVLTTPQCQFLVMSHNQGIAFHNQSYYVNHFSSIFKSLIQKPIQGQLIVDCADGVGGIWMRQFAAQLKDVISITVINDGENVQTLNDGCGSEFVQKSKKLPKNHIINESARYAAVDGDADRLIYYDLHQNQVRLVEGDRFAILFAKYITKHITKGRIGIIQTAYANAASTKYIKDILKLDVRFEPTGVKYLHRAAHEYDIGIYFEANGHGAVVVNDRWDGDQELKDFIKLSNQAVGDAITNLLMSEYLLYKLEMTVNDWIELYHDYPSITTKMAVRNKQIVKTNYDETQIIEPIELKNQVHKRLEKYGPDYRVLIRPSGTEDVVRILCEGPKEDLNQQLSLEMYELLKQFMDVI